MAAAAEADGTVAVERLLQDLLDAAPDAILAVGGDGRVAFANQQAGLLFQHGLDDLIGRSVEQLVPPRFRDAHRTHRRRYGSEPSPRPMGALRPVEAIRRDGTTIPVEISLSSLTLPSGPLTVASVRDVTARRQAEERVVRVSRLYSMLAAADAAILRAATPAEVYDALCRVVTDRGDFPLVWVGLPTDDGALEPVARAGSEVGYVESIRVPLNGVGMSSEALRYGRTVVVQDVEADHRFEQWRHVARRHGLASGCAVPLRSGDHVVGAVCTYLGEVGGFDEDRVQLLERLVADASFALQSLENRRAEAEAREAQRRSEASLAARAAMHAEVARLGQLALTSPDLDGVLDAIVEGVPRVLGLDGAVLEQVDPESGGIVLRATAGLDGVPRTVVTVDRSGHTFGGHLAATREPVVVEDFEADDVPFRARSAVAAGMRSGAGVLIEKRGQVHGALIVGSREPRAFPQDEVAFLQSVANIVAASVERAEVNQELLSLALHDPLTGLPNRALLHDRLAHAIDRVDRGRGTVGVLLVDLDGFKLVNDALGHNVGDELLVAVATRLTGAVRAGDTVARLGGDEFAVLCEDITSPDEATLVAERIADAMAEPFRLGTVETFVTASTGITVRSKAGSAPETLLREADAAMYRAKESGRARYEVFDDRMRDQAVARLGLTNALRRAVEREEFRLVWHPELPLLGAPHPQLPLADATPGVVGHDLWAEALLRWDHPVQGTIPPDRFIGLAEESGLITVIGEWVLREACRQLREWEAGDLPCPEVISVNLSARQLAQPDLLAVVDRAISDTGVDPSRVMLEITETAVMSDPRSSIARLGALRGLGLRIAIDDFGTGYSSMGYLRDLPVDALKIDRSFVRWLGSRHDDRAIVEGIVGLAHAVGLRVIAEGVENETQLAALRAMGCDRAQGFLWTPPIDGRELGPWLAGHLGGT